MWSELLSQNIRSNDLKTQKVQTGITKSTIVIGICTDSIALLAHTDQRLEQHRRDSIVFTLDKSFRQLAKNVPAISRVLFGDDLPKSLTTIKANRTLLNNTSTSMASKNYSQFPQFPRYHQQGSQRYGNQHYHKQQNKYQKSKNKAALEKDWKKPKSGYN